MKKKGTCGFLSDCLRIEQNLEKQNMGRARKLRSLINCCPFIKDQLDQEFLRCLHNMRDGPNGTWTHPEDNDLFVSDIAWRLMPFDNDEDGYKVIQLKITISDGPLPLEANEMVIPEDHKAHDEENDIIDYRGSFALDEERGFATIEFVGKLDTHGYRWYQEYVRQFADENGNLP